MMETLVRTKVELAETQGGAFYTLLFSALRHIVAWPPTTALLAYMIKGPLQASQYFRRDR